VIDPDRDTDFTATALPLLGAVARVARAIANDASDAEDLVQETYLRAYRSWHTFVPGTDCLRWLATICRNLRIDQGRRASHETVVDDIELESLASARLHKAAMEAGVGDMYTRIDLGPAIVRAIGRLDRPFREVVVLADVDGLSYEEIAAQLDIPVGTVRSRLYRARRQLQEMLLAYAVDAGFANVPVGATSRQYVLPARQ
jgi:RNA polymerase sigma-70 factor (ECF subfamily)